MAMKQVVMEVQRSRQKTNLGGRLTASSPPSPKDEEMTRCDGAKLAAPPSRGLLEQFHLPYQHAGQVEGHRRPEVPLRMDPNAEQPLRPSLSKPQAIISSHFSVSSPPWRSRISPDFSRSSGSAGFCSSTCSSPSTMMKDATV